MTNDTNTLNGALRELGETMAANLTTQGVPSTYDEGLTTLAGKILDITPGPGPTPTPASIDLTGTKSILSYVDSDSTVLTATVLDSSDNPVEGVDVNLYNGSTLWDTLTTDSSGEVSKTYSSAGSGDITFTAEVDGTLLTKTFVVEDCLKVGFNNWNGTFTTGTDTYDYIQITGTGVSPNITLPSNWEMSYKLKNTRTADYADGSGLWVIGTDTNNGVLIGHEGTDCRIRIYSRSGGSNTVRATENNVYSYQTWTDAVITYNNGAISLTIGGKTVSYSLSSSIIMQFYSNYSYLRIAEWKIKPL